LIVKSSSSTTGLWLYLNGLNATLSNQDSGSLAFQTNGTDRLTISSAGTATFTGALSGTSATFTANANGVVLNAATGTTNTQFKIANTSGDNYSGVAASDGSSVFSGTTAYSAYLGTNVARSLHFATNGVVRQTIDLNGAATFSSTIAASTSITVTNSGAQAAILSAVSAFADGYRATLRLWNQHTGGKAWELYSTNVADGAYGAGKLAFVNSTDSVTAMVMSSNGQIGIGIGGTTPQGLLSLRATTSDTPTIVFQNLSGGPSSAIANFTSAVQTFTTIGTNAYVNSVGSISRLNTSYASCFIAFDEGDIGFSTGTSGGNPSQRMRITSNGKVTINPTIAGDDIVNVTNASSTGYGMSVQGGNGGNYIFTARNYLGTGQFTAYGNGAVQAPRIGANTGTTMVLDADGYLRTSSSSIRYKKDINPIDIGLDFILSLNPVSYNLKDGDKAQVGFIAEDFPDERLISFSMIDTEDATKGYQKEGVNYSQIVAPLVKAIQDQQAQIEELKALIAAK